MGSPASSIDTTILRCPLTGADLSLVDEQALDELRRNIAAGSVRHVSGAVATVQPDEALATPDGAFVYPVVKGILHLLPQAAIGADTSNFRRVSGTDETMRFYDSVGWQQHEDGSFEDAVLFEDLRPVSKDYIHHCHLRVKDHLPAAGKYLLDVASGPVQYPEYLTYSERYERRICADVSIAALRAAQRKLGERAIYIQCDMTELPLKDESVDAFVSLHTIYHIPAERQHLAFRHLERVLKRGGSGVVVYSWGPHSLAMKVLTADLNPRRLARSAVPDFVVELLRGKRQPPPSDAALYYQPHNYRWVREQVGHWDALVWRSVSVPFMKRYVHSALMGKPMLTMLFRLESAFPRFFGRFGMYPMLVCRKH